MFGCFSPDFISFGGIADTLKIGHIAGRTVAQGPGISTVAVDMAVKEINAAGGINGKMVKLLSL